MSAKGVAAIKRLAPLDGLRGLAIILVLGHHFFAHTATSSTWLGPIYQQLGKGWIGVDLFFVLSGFLITGILIRTRSEAHYIRNFYARRFLRISPLYYGIVGLIFLVLIPLGWVQKESGAPSSAWFWLYGTNFLICRLGSFKLGLVHWPLNHLWSLAVEEHFYLLWPFIVLWINPRRLWAVCLVLICAMLAARSWYAISTHDWIAPYVHSAFRSDSLLIGALVATLNRFTLNQTRLKHAYFYTFVGTVVLCVVCQKLGWMSFGRDTLSMQTGGYTYLALIFGALVGYLSLAEDRSLICAGLSHPALKFFGQYSYGLYMFHPFLLTFFGLGQHKVVKLLSAIGAESALPVVSAAIVTAASVGLAVLSWHCLEHPLSKLKHHFEGSTPSVPIEKSAAGLPPEPAVSQAGLSSLKD